MAANFDGLRFSHWQTELRADGIVVLAFDRQGTSVNAFSQDVLIELADARRLMLRVLIVWLAVVALIVLAGWIA